MPEEPMTGLSSSPQQAPPWRQIFQLSMEIDDKLANPETAHDSGLGAAKFRIPHAPCGPPFLFFYT